MFTTIKTFIDVATEGSFSAVARQQDVAVSSVTRKIDSLEAELGVKLFARNSRSILLTDAGEHFLQRAKNILAEIEDAKHAMDDLHAAPRGVMTITVPSAFGRRHIIPAIASFLELYPQIEIEMHSSDERVDLLTQRVDVAIRIGVLLDSDLVATQLATVRRFACASPLYIERHGRPATPTQLVDHNCLTLATTPLPPGWWCFAGVNRGSPVDVKGTMRTDDAAALLQAAIEGIGIVHLASWLVSDALKAGSLVSLFPDVPASSMSVQPAVYAVRMPGRSHLAKAKPFIDHLKKCFNEPHYWDVV